MFGLENLPFSNLEQFIQWGGIVVLFIIVFAESGLFFGFFLPGDSLLFTAGLLAAGGYFNVWTLTISLVAAAIMGDQVGFWTGKFFGKKLFTKGDTKFFKRKHVDAAHEFYEKHGVMAIILARFMPIVRTFAPIVAGAVDMSYRKFVMYNVIGGFLWVCLMVLSGYYLVQFIPGLKDYLEYIILGIIFVSILPIAWEYYKGRKTAA
jgi:membrane-associated protein